MGGGGGGQRQSLGSNDSELKRRTDFKQRVRPGHSPQGRMETRAWSVGFAAGSLGESRRGIQRGAAQRKRRAREMREKKVPCDSVCVPPSGGVYASEAVAWEFGRKERLAAPAASPRLK